MSTQEITSISPLSLSLLVRYQNYLYPEDPQGCNNYVGGPLRFIVRIILGTMSETGAAFAGSVWHLGKAIYHYKTDDDTDNAQDHRNCALVDAVIAIWGITTCYFGVMALSQPFITKRIVMISLPLILPFVYACNPPMFNLE